MRFQDTKDFITGDEADLGDTMGITEGDADLGWSETLSGEFDAVVDDVFWGCFEPCWRGAAVGEGGGRLRVGLVGLVGDGGERGWVLTDALAWSVHATHGWLSSVNLSIFVGV